MKLPVSVVLAVSVIAHVRYILKLVITWGLVENSVMRMHSFVQNAFRRVDHEF